MANTQVDSQAQPSWISSLVTGLLGKMGMNAAAAQGGPSTPAATPPTNPWVQSAAPSTASDPNSAAIQGQAQSNSTLKDLFRSLMGSASQGSQGGK